MRHLLTPLLALVLAGSAGLALPARAATAADTTTRLVVKYKTQAQAASTERARTRVKALAEAAGVELSALRQTATGATVYTMAQPLTLARARQVAARVAADANVAYALPDVRVKATALPSDTYASSQWSLRESSSFTGAANLFAAWPASTSRIVVAVVDTGLLAHPDLTSNQIGGYDFISDSTIAGDGDGRDDDPTDVGDYCDDEGTDSSWHATSVAGLIAAEANNAYGVAGGAAANARILHARALGRCGGYLSDVADAVVWSAGGSVSGVPTNTTPARVINLSLGAEAGTSCYAYLQEAVDEAVSRQAVVVVAAGNDGAASVGAPANCSDVIAVGAHTAGGDLASYSNHSADVALTAPGGGSCMLLTSCDSRPTYTIGNTGTRSAGTMSELTGFAGTSAAAPHVAAAAALLLAVDDSLTPAQVRSLLVSTAASHPSGTYCANNAGQCGAGMLDAQAAVAALETPVVTISGSSVVQGSATVTLTASVSGVDSSYSYAWTQVSGPSVTLSGAATASLSFTAPATKGTAMVFKVVVTSSAGQSGSSSWTVSVNNPATADLPDSWTATAGTAFSTELEGSDADGDTVYFTLVSGPTGMTVTDNVLSWPSPVAGTYSVVLAVSDDADASVSDATQVTVTLTVSAAGSTTTSDDDDGGGGGGALHWSALLALALGLAWRRVAR